MATKLEEAIDLLQSDAGADLSNAEAARRLDCSEAHIRRARAVIAAQDKVAERSDDPSEAGRLLADVLSATEAEELIEVAIADLKEELKELRGQRKDMAEQRRNTIRSARETYPLFDQKPEGKPGGKPGKPSLAAVG